MDKERIEKIYNKALCERYPFLIAHSVWADKPKEDYDYIILDLMPSGWRRAFGIQMCEEIRKILIENDFLYDYRIDDIKEKYGELRWYDFGAPQEVYNITNKYRKLSRKICICCGQPATKISMGWISPWCDKCANKLLANTSFKDIKGETE